MTKFYFFQSIIFLCSVTGENRRLSEQEKLLEHQRNFALLAGLQDGNRNNIDTINAINIKTIDLVKEDKSNHLPTTYQRKFHGLNSDEAYLSRDNTQSTDIDDSRLDSVNTHISSRINQEVHPPSSSPIIKTIQVPVEVPKPYAVHVPHPVPVPVHIKIPVPIERPYPVHITKTIAIPVEKPVYIRVPQPYQVPVAQPYPVAVPQPVEVKVPYPVYIKSTVNEQVNPVYIKSTENAQTYPLYNKNTENSQVNGTEIPSIDIRSNFNNVNASNTSDINTVVPIQNSLLDSYRPSRLGGIYGNSFNQFQPSRQR